MDADNVSQERIVVEHGKPLAWRSYKYDALPEGYIRLLSLDGVKTKGMINCTLYQAPLDLPLARTLRPKYCALSYRWGDSSPEDPWILVRGRKLQIGRNLFSFLCQVSRIERRPYLWIDALCINQRSTPERNQQVQMMEQIYRQADQVIVWLGEDKLAKPSFIIDLGKGLAHSIEQCDDASLESWSTLFDLGYWSRMWVVQEIRHASPTGLFIMHGSQLIHWDDF